MVVAERCRIRVHFRLKILDLGLGSDSMTGAVRACCRAREYSWA